MSIAIIVLAAGQGTRMASDLPKVLHEIGHAPLLHHALNSAAPLEPTATVVVAGPEGDAVPDAARAFAPNAEIVRQTERLGTAHAVAQAGPALAGFEGDAIVLYGDTPFVAPETLHAMQKARADGAGVVVLGFEAADPTGYGRLVLGREGGLEAIVEHKDASAEQRRITLCNSGVVCANAQTLFSLVAEVGNENAKGEYYLTDIVGIARARGLSCAAVTCPEDETLGINTRAELAGAEAIFQARARAAAMAAGATLQAPETVFFAHDTQLGRDVVVEPFTVFGPGVTVGSGARIRAHSHLEGAHVGEGAIIGPFARLRPGANLGADTRIGNFVEIKAADIAPGAKVNHLSYIGDASIGSGANIGAGTITCNYDGVFKHRTTIGEGAFVGSNSALVAPVVIGDGGYVASGSVVTADVPESALAFGRARQVNKPGLGRKLVEKLRAMKRGAG